MCQNVNDEIIVNVPPYHFIHVFNSSKCVIRLVVGPAVFVCRGDEKVVLGPEKMKVVPPLKYCIVGDPILKNADGTPMMDDLGQVKLRMGHVEYRFSGDPFPIYPGEKFQPVFDKLPILDKNSGLYLRALVDFWDGNIKRIAGQEWLIQGPVVYYPREEVEIVEKVFGSIIDSCESVDVIARKDCVDYFGIKRSAHERWSVDKPGLYMPGPYEYIEGTYSIIVLTKCRAAHITTRNSFVDKENKHRSSGEQYLVTRENSPCFFGSHLCVYHLKNLVVLTKDEYCVILNPVDSNDYPQFGKKLLIKGPKSFFLKPYEKLLYDHHKQIEILEKGQGVILLAQDSFVDQVPDLDNPDKMKQIVRHSGEQWLVRGPTRFVCPLEAKIITHREIIPLSPCEGIYVQNTRTGQVRSVIGEGYMLDIDEALWKKEVPTEVIDLLSSNMGHEHFSTESFDTTRVLTFQVPHNAAVRICDHLNKTSRVELGPTLVMLEPNEQFTLLSLSGGKPKKPAQIKSLFLSLGPDSFSDIIKVETSDHTHLSLKVSFNWMFHVPVPCNDAEAIKLFAIPDFIGVACKTMASRIRGAITSVKFEDFHKHFSRIIRSSVFGLQENGEIRDCLIFSQNNLHITGIDIQSLEPTDKRTYDSLQNSVQLAIDITIKSQEAAARHEAERLEQEAKGRLEKQKVDDELAACQARRILMEAVVKSAAMESTGQAKVEADGRAEAACIEGKAEIELAKLQALANSIRAEADLNRLRLVYEAELNYQTQLNEMELDYETSLTEIEIDRFETMVNTVDPKILSSISKTQSDSHICMLKALGLKSSLITNGETPVNLVNTAEGLVGIHL